MRTLDTLLVDTLDLKKYIVLKLLNIILGKMGIEIGCWKIYASQCTMLARSTFPSSLCTHPSLPNSKQKQQYPYNQHKLANPSSHTRPHPRPHITLRHLRRPRNTPIHHNSSSRTARPTTIPIRTTPPAPTTPTIKPPLRTPTNP